MLKHHDFVWFVFFFGWEVKNGTVDNRISRSSASRWKGGCRNLCKDPCMNKRQQTSLFDRCLTVKVCRDKGAIHLLYVYIYIYAMRRYMFLPQTFHWFKHFMTASLVYSFFGCTLHTVVFCHGCCYHYPRIAYGNFMQSTALCSFVTYFLSICSMNLASALGMCLRQGIYLFYTVLIPFSAKESIFMRSWFHATACSGLQSQQGRAGVTGSKTTGTRSQVARMKRDT